MSRDVKASLYTRESTLSSSDLSFLYFFKKIAIGGRDVGEITSMLTTFVANPRKLVNERCFQLTQLSAISRRAEQL